MYIKTQKFLIMGASKSGFAVVKYLYDHGAKCSVYEELKNAKAQDAVEKLRGLGVNNLTREQVEEELNNIDVLVLSPGVPINHEIAVKAKQMGKRIIGEIEFAYMQFIPPIIAVTGTNGKTTTATLIDKILSEGGIETQLLGNVGVPFTSRVKEINYNTVCVAEISSYQLESMYSFMPHITCILNISPDHLERHYSMENYVFLKKRIFRNQRESEYAVLNYDDKLVRGFFTEVKAKTIWVSLKDKVEGAYRKDGKLYFFDEYIIEENQLKLNGDHNVYNVLFAIAAAKLIGVESESVRRSLAEFRGVRHRIEYVGTKNGVDYFNDSKATNTSSTINALETIKKPTILILGGSEKGENYDALFQKIKECSVKQVILTGASRFNMLDCAGKLGLTDVTVTENFFYAIKIAALFAVEGDAVLLSPACASFDRFNGFEERGDAFVKAVEEL